MTELQPHIDLLAVPAPPYRVRTPRAVLAASQEPSRPPESPLEVPPAPSTPTPLESTVEQESHPAANVLLERAEDIPDVIGALDIRGEEAQRESAEIGGSDEVQTTARQRIIDIRDTTKHRILGDGPGKRAPTVPTEDFHEDLDEQSPAQRVHQAAQEATEQLNRFKSAQELAEKFKREGNAEAQAQWERETESLKDKVRAAQDALNTARRGELPLASIVEPATASSPQTPPPAPAESPPQAPPAVQPTDEELEALLKERRLAEEETKPASQPVVEKPGMPREKPTGEEAEQPIIEVQPSAAAAEGQPKAAEVKPVVGEPKEPERTSTETKGGPSRTPRTTELPTMGFWESWWKRLDLPSRPQNAFDSVKIAFHERFALKHRQKGEELGRYIKTLEGIIGETKKKVDTGQESTKRLWTMEGNLRKLQRKANGRAQMESKWNDRRDRVVQGYIERLEAATDPILGDMDRLQQEGKSIEGELTELEQKLNKKRSVYRDLVAQGAEKRILERMNARITVDHVKKEELYRKKEMLGKRQRRMNRATSVWTDRHNELRALLNRRTTKETPPPQEVSLNPQAFAPSPAAAMRSPETATSEEGESEPSHAIDALLKQWEHADPDKKFVIGPRVKERIIQYLQKREGDTNTYTKQEFADLLDLLKPKWRKQIKKYQQQS